MRRTVSLAIASCAVATILATAAGGKQSKARDSQPTQGVVVDINRAGAADFENLPGIGPELARRIVTYRKKHGPFRHAEDLLAIRGMGPKKWRAIRPYLRVGDGRPTDDPVK